MLRKLTRSRSKRLKKKIKSTRQILKTDNTRKNKRRSGSSWSKSRKLPWKRSTTKRLNLNEMRTTALFS